MKKITAFLLSIVAIFALVACGSSVKASISLVNTTSETIIIDVKVTDKGNALVSGSLVAKAFLDGSQKSEQKTYDEVEDKDNTYRFKVGGLTYDTTYVVKIYGTVGDEQVEFDSKSFTTKAEGATKDDSISVSTPEEFLDIQDSPSSYFVLKNDIDFEGRTIKAEDFFGTSSSSSAFKGNLDGGGFSIKNLNLTSSSKPQYLGLFGYVNGDSSREEETIKDLVIDNVNILNTTYYGTVHAGILAGRVSNTSTISNVKVINSRIQLKTEGNSQTSSNIGGAIGHLEGKAQDVVTSNVDVNVHHVGLNSINIGGAIGYVYHSSNPKVLERISSDGNINFNGYITSTQAKATIINIGGAIGNFNIHKQAMEIGSNVDINVNDFKYISRETEITDNYKRINDSIRVGGLIGEVSSNYQISKGFYSGSIYVNSSDDFGRIEEVIVSGLIARANDTIDVSNLSRIGTGKTITVNTQSTNQPMILVSDVDAFAGDAKIISSDESKVYGASNYKVNGIAQAPSTITPGDGIAVLNSEFLTEVSANKNVYINHALAYSHKVAFEVRVSDVKSEYNLANIEVAVYDGNTKVQGVKLDQFTGSFSGLSIDKEYTIRVLNGTDIVDELKINTLSVGISYANETRGFSKLGFDITLADANTLVKENTLEASIYQNGVFVKSSKATDNKTINYDALTAGTNYNVIVTATVNEVEKVALDSFEISTQDLVSVNLAAPVTIGATKITFKPSLVENAETKINYQTLKAAIYQNNTLIEAKEFTNNTATPQEVSFDGLSINTVYRLVLRATVDGVADVIIGVVGDGSYQTLGITASINEGSINIQNAATANTVDLTFTVGLVDPSGDATGVKVELWYNGKIGKTPVDYVDDTTVIEFTNLKSKAVVTIRITAVINGVTVVIGEQAVSLSIK
ncbi:hypothetical protein LJC17_01715 [Acholeplasma sp. OttesenSCG-928-E16]|nr:hypothetical protein [Acholeplasma sp. OttesenSCG-928-E16]